MKDYLFHTLSPGDFETLVVKLCHQILGLGTISFSTGPDGGRDAFFEGTAERYPSSRDPWSGKFVIQAKHTEKADASCSDSDFDRLLFSQSRRLGAAKPEAAKVAALRDEGQCDCYILFTNRKLGSLTEKKLVGELRQETGVPNVAILGKETLTTYLDDAPQIAEALNLQAAPYVAGLPTIAPPTRDFAGRTDELDELRRQVRDHGGAVIFGVRGLGGIGKTELCRKLVDEIGDDYPDGHVLIDLRGASEKPLSPSEGLAEAIRAYEPQARLPDAERDLRRLYDQVLKDRRAIVFLDDAASAEQVEPLLPHTGCLTLVTSRHRFSLPKLHRLDLDALTPEAARELLLSLAPRLGDEADRIAELLGRLPLALRLAGSAFAERPGLTADKYVRKLESRDERVGLVEAAIDFNYSALSAERQQQWRALSVFSGDFNAEAAAAVWELAVEASEDILDCDLYAVSLVECHEGRYRLHDLARDFATSLLRYFATQRLESEELLRQRHAVYYLKMLETLERHVDSLKIVYLEWANFSHGLEYIQGKLNATLNDHDQDVCHECMFLVRYQRARNMWLKTIRGILSLKDLNERLEHKQHALANQPGRQDLLPKAWAGVAEAEKLRDTLRQGTWNLRLRKSGFSLEQEPATVKILQEVESLVSEMQKSASALEIDEDLSRATKVMGTLFLQMQELGRLRLENQELIDHLRETHPRIVIEPSAEAKQELESKVQIMEEGALFRRAASLKHHQGRHLDAERLYEHSRERYEEALGAGHPRLASLDGNLGRIYCDQQQHDEAEARYRRALAILDAASTGEYARVEDFYNHLANICSDERRYDDANRMNQRSLEVQAEARQEEVDFQLSLMLLELASLYKGHGHRERALPLLQRALQTLERTTLSTDSAFSSTIEKMTRLCHDMLAVDDE
jgi:Tfp pilus assembly protein PilF